jgi:hypothetical protein
MEIKSDNNFQHLIDMPINLRCPHCCTLSALIPVAVPDFQMLHRFKLTETGIVYRCSSCNRAVFLKFNINALTNPVQLSDEFVQISVSLEPFEMQYLTGDVAEDFQEALTCYANSCWNAFAAMCRRCVQSVSSTLGADGSNKVQAQLQDLKAMGIADEETFDQLHAIMLSGHDGAHPHLPPLSAARAEVLLQVMKDVLYQLFVRTAKIREASELRKAAITAKNAG